MAVSGVWKVMAQRTKRQLTILICFAGGAIFAIQVCVGSALALGKSTAKAVHLQVTARTQDDLKPSGWQFKNGCVPTVYGMMIEYAAKKAGIALDKPTAHIQELHNQYLKAAVLRSSNNATDVVGAGLTPEFVRSLSIGLNGGACNAGTRSIASAQFNPIDSSRWSYDVFAKNVHAKLAQGYPIAIAAYIFGRKTSGGGINFVTGHEMLVTGFDPKNEIFDINDTWASTTNAWRRLDLTMAERNTVRIALGNTYFTTLPRPNFDVVLSVTGSAIFNNVNYVEVIAVLEGATSTRWGNSFVTLDLDISPCDQTSSGGCVCIDKLSPQSSVDAIVKAIRCKPGKVITSKQAGRLQVELADLDGLFTYYEAPSADAERELWVMAFLDDYFRSPLSDEFLKKFRETANRVLDSYAAVCSPNGSRGDRAECIRRDIKKRYKIRSGGGRYDEGNRCLVWDDRKFNPTRDCKPY